MANNFKVKFVTDGDANMLQTSGCCEPKIYNVRCSDLKLGQDYDLSLSNDSNDYQSKIFPTKYSFTATSSLNRVNIINAGLYLQEPRVVLEGGGANIDAQISAVFSNTNGRYSITEIIVNNSGDGYKELPTIRVIGDSVVPAVLVPELLPINKYVTFLVSFVCDTDNIPQTQV